MTQIGPVLLFWLLSFCTPEFLLKPQNCCNTFVALVTIVNIWAAYTTILLRWVADRKTRAETPSAHGSIIYVNRPDCRRKKRRQNYQRASVKRFQHPLFQFGNAKATLEAGTSSPPLPRRLA